MNLNQIRLQQSGLCEKFNCSVQDLLDLWEIWNLASPRDTIGDDWILLLSQMQSSLPEIRLKFEAIIKQHNESILEIEIMRANGTLEEWKREAEEEWKETGPLIKEIFDKVSSTQPPIKIGNFN